MSVVVVLRRAAAVLTAVVVLGAGVPGPAAHAIGPARPPGQLCSALWTDPGSRTVRGVVVHGDLVVDEGCVLADTTVTGDVTLLDGSGLRLEFRAVVRGDVRSTVEPPGYDPALTAHWATIGGDVVVPGYAHLYDTTVHGDVVLEAGTGGGVILGRSRVVGGVRGTVGSLSVRESAVLGPVDVVTGTDVLRVNDSTLGSSLTAGGDRLVVHDSRIRGSLASTGSEDVLVCRTHVDGDLTVTEVRGWSQVGQEGSEHCRTTVGGSVHLRDNPHSVVLGDLAVGGDLVCAGNTGPQGVVRTERLTVAGTAAAPCEVGAPAEQPAPREHRCSDLLGGRPWDEVRGVQVRGDLVVDTTCRLADVTVTGDVTSVPGAGVFAYRTTFEGSLHLVSQSNLTDSTVLGDVRVETPVTDELGLSTSRVGGDVVGTAGSTRLSSSAVVGGYDVTTTSFARFQGGVVGGPLRSGGGRLLVHDATMADDLLSDGSADVLVCRSTVDGDLTVTGVQGWSRVGAEGTLPCATVVGGSLVLVDNPHSLVVGDVAVAGDVVCSGNTGPQGVTLGEALTVGGARPARCS
ncbi:hypothetical protein [Cellulomonas cellasea]|uniref:Uncharacterized protein n=1 Tax=Cellulomonas cellasea TaxID=43670 RepID=A0A7W4UGI8_9CELL|nr:hypothetical protein [Cellulomonas cellasea]MBB2923744.1 hypothetical protein [Cellulomonas cellasea]